MAVPVLVGGYQFFFTEVPLGAKILVAVACLFLSLLGVIHTVKEERDKRRQDRQIEQLCKKAEHQQYLLERQELRGQGLPTTYIDGLGEHPILKHMFNEGQAYEKEYEFEKAIEKYQECLSHPDATDESKVAAYMLIGNCRYMQSMFKEAEEHYRAALDISKRAKDG